EILYWPIFLLFVCLWLINEQQGSYKIAVLEGLLCYFGYLTKEMFLALMLAYTAFEIIWPLLSHSRYQKKKFIMLCVFLAVFMFCHVVMKLTLFRGLGNSYNQMGIEAIMSFYKFAYMMYAFFYSLAALSAAVLIIPFIYPVIHFKTLSEDGRKLFCYVVLFFLIASATIAYTISVREDIGRIAPRFHLRYLGPACILLLTVFFSCIQRLELDVMKKNLRNIVYFMIVVSLYMFFILKGTIIGSSVDQFTLLWHVFLSKYRLYPASSGITDNGIIIYLGAYLANFFIILIVTGFLYVCYKSKKRAVVYLMIIFTAVCMANNVAAYKLIYNSCYRDSATLKEVTSMNDYFKNMKRELSILYLTEGDKINKLSHCMDTYMDYTNNLYYVDDIFLTSKHKGEVINIAGTVLREHIWDTPYEGVKAIDYIILENSIDLGDKRLANVERVDEISGVHYTVYKNLDPAVIELR
nr:hypothetical protein [Fretibacterium sp.]